ncbi:MAG: hypothetical protein AMJ75_11195 [Phycisphaerae bacterium SM1_79]|nr:MAG: hypothetical protein AMJ75_11195 [Phycisphaerae bacterium SM1_79]
MWDCTPKKFNGVIRKDGLIEYITYASRLSKDIGGAGVVRPPIPKAVASFSSFMTQAAKSVWCTREAVKKSQESKLK